MDPLLKSVAVFSAVVVVVCAWKVFNMIWLKPKKLEKLLRDQGFNGNSYNLLFGDLKMVSAMIKEAKSKPISLSTDIVPRVLPWVHDSITKYGKNNFIWMGTIPRIHIMDPELVREVLRKYDNFRKITENPAVKMLANGLSLHEGKQWAKHRKIINPAFHVEKLKLMLPAFYLSCSELISKWEAMITTTTQSCEFDVCPYLETMTADAISRTAFGSSYDEGQKIFQLQKEQVELLIQAALSIYFPGLRFLPTKRNKRMKEIHKNVKVLLQNIIHKKIAAMKEGERSDDLLGILLESNLNEIQHGDNSAGMSINDVIEECKLFYFAGQETTSVLLTWTMVLLSMNPTWQDKAREEVLQIFGDERPNFDGLNHLKIVTMILNEVLRLYPPVVSLSRSVYKETTLGNMILPAGVQLSVPLLLIHQDYEIWGNDAKEFKPERFSEGVSKASKNKISLFSFSSGPRICIGQNFAMLEAKLALCMILKNFSFGLSASYTHAPFSLITMQPQHGANLVLHKL